jgi:endonuclease-3
VPDLQRALEIIDRTVAVGREDSAIASLCGGSLFELLVAVVLSQNTSDKNARRAYERLREGLGPITPEAVLGLREGELAELIRPAGMHRKRARCLKALASEFLRAQLTPEKLAAMGAEGARRLLLGLPGVGRKTADVILACLGLPAFPVDTHIMRVARRLGVGRVYDEVSRRLVESLPPGRYLELHLKLIKFGREICTARAPNCRSCPLSSLCPSSALTARGSGEGSSS